VVLEGVVLEQVNDVEFVHAVFAGVAHAKLEPLGVAPGVLVRLEDEVVFVLLHLDGPTQVARLEPAFEDQRLVLGTL